MNREKLPQRRHSETRDYVWERFDGMQIPMTVTYGRSEPGSPIKEVFINHGKEGMDLALILADAATILSIALQRDTTPAELLKSIRREPNGKPSSCIGFIISQLAKANKPNSVPEGDEGGTLSLQTFSLNKIVSEKIPESDHSPSSLNPATECSA